MSKDIIENIQNQIIESVKNLPLSDVAKHVFVETIIQICKEETKQNEDERTS